MIDFVACGDNFVMLLTTQGLVFSFGKACSEGQLGHGDRRERLAPELINSFKELGERIQAISCGYKHCVAKSSLGKVYTWGCGSMGQLGHGNFDSIAIPKRLANFKDAATSKEGESFKKKCTQIAAGYSHTVVLTDNRVPYWCGTCGSIYKQNSAIKVNLEKKYPDLFGNKQGQQGSVPSFAIAKIKVSWSRTMSITCFTALDMRSFVPPVGVSGNTTGPTNPAANLMTQINNLSSKWNTFEMDPPFIDSIAGFFSNSTMRKPKRNKKKSPIKTQVEKTELIKITLRKGINELFENTNNQELDNKIKEVVDELQESLEKEPEQRTEHNANLINQVFNKTFK